MKLKLTGKLVAAFLALGLVPLAVLAFISIRSAANIKDGATEKLRQSAIATLDVIERNLFERYGDVQAFAANGILQTHSLDDPASRPILTDAINTYVRLYGIYPVSIITNAAGKVVAVNTLDAAGKPVSTEVFLGKDMSSATWFKDAVAGRFLKSELLDGTVVEDVSHDPDAAKVLGSDAMVITFSAPIRDGAGKLIGVWHNYADFSLVEDIVIESYKTLAGQGLRSTEFLLTNRRGDFLMEYDPMRQGENYTRNMSEMLKFNAVSLGNEEIPRALKGESGVAIAKHCRKAVLMGAGYAQSQGALGYPGLGWALMVRESVATLMAGPNAAIRSTWITLAVAGTLLVVCAVLVARSITRPISRCVAVVESLAKGDLTAQVGIRRADEVGVLATSIDACIANLREIVGRLSSSSQSLLSSAQVLKESSHSQAAASEETTAQAHTVAAAGEELSVNARAMSESAGEITRSTGTVAAAMEEMSSSIQEVARNCAKESEIARKADEQARHTRDQMARLDESAREIGKVVELINRIAEQTNLLALNAAIEAASAGEAGRGFAVVANEVKELARQSASATEDIRKQIALIQGNAGASMKSLEEVGKVIEQVSHIASSIAAAVEEQSATTSEIVGTIHQVSTSTATLSKNVTQTAEGAAEVARNIAGVSQAAADVSKSAVSTSTASTELDSLANELSRIVVRFKV